MAKFAFIVNPVSGGKDKSGIIDNIRKSFADCEVLYTEYPGHAGVLAASSDADIVVAVGGDGTVNEIAGALVNSGKALGIIPCGSGNGLALHLGISRNHKKAIRQLKNALPCMMDSGTMNGRPFFCTAGVGFDAKVGLEFSRSRSRGLLTYVSVSARNWFAYKPDYYRILLDGTLAWEGKAVLVTAGNANQWGNNAKICGGASVTDGLLDVTVVKPFSTLMFPALLARLVSGRVQGCRKTVCLRGAGVRIERMSEGPAHYDGEPLQEGKELEIKLMPSSLKVMAPKTDI